MADVTHKDVGDYWQPVWTFQAGGVDTDPGAITFRIRDPSGNVTTVTEATPAAPTAPVTRVSVGVFRLDIAIDEPGYWYAKADATGAVAAAAQHAAIGDPDPFTDTWGLSDRALVGLGETRDWLNRQNVTVEEDNEIVRVINDLSDRFHHEAGREFKAHGVNPQARTFPVDALSMNRRMVFVGDLASAPTTVEVLDTDWATVLETVAAADYTLLPTVREPWEPIRRLELHTDVTVLRAGMRVRVTGTYGFPAVPGDVRQAVLDAVVEALDRDVEHYRSDFGPATAGEGQNVIVFGNRPSILSMPPRSLAVAWRYRDPLIA